jgi:diaminopimelate decarboxylase
VKTAGKESKFGIASEELPIAAELAAKHGVHVAALHAHVGSGILSSTTWRENADYLAACVSTSLRLRPSIWAGTLTATADRLLLLERETPT